MTSLERDILINLTGPEDNDMNGVEAKLDVCLCFRRTQMAIMTVKTY